MLSLSSCRACPAATGLLQQPRCCWVSQKELRIVRGQAHTGRRTARLVGEIEVAIEAEAVDGIEASAGWAGAERAGREALHAKTLEQHETAEQIAVLLQAVA